MILQWSVVLLAVCLQFHGVPSVLASSISQNIFSGHEVFKQNAGFVIPVKRAKRAFTMPKLTQQELEGALKFSEGVVDRFSRIEQNLINGRVVLQFGSPTFNAMTVSLADDNALLIAKGALINSKASLYLANKNCMRYGKSSAYCAEQLQKETKTCIKNEKCPNSRFRSYDGSCNNLENPDWGATYSPFSRLLSPAYDDGFWEARGSLKRISNPFTITEMIIKQVDAEKEGTTDYTLAMIAWANLVFNDVGHSVSNRMMSTGENIMCCGHDGFKLAPRYIHPLCLSVTRAHNQCINYVRSMLSSMNKCHFGQAQQMNAVSHFLDGSGIYGSTVEMAQKLRTFNNGELIVEVPEDGNTKLSRTLDLVCHHDGGCYLAGERRINVDTVGAVLHTILVREHNRIAEQLALLNPDWEDEQIYQHARRIVVAEIQHITYNEWLPIILGKKLIDRWQLKLSSNGQRVYNKNVEPSISNSFANAATRFVNSMVGGKLRLCDETRSPKDSVLVHESISQPDILDKKGMLDALVRGITSQRAQAVDLTYSEAVIKYMFSGDNSTGLDGFILDMQRGRDHGLPGYIEYRKLFGLSYQSFDKLSDSIPKPVLNKLKKVYHKVSDIDLLVGGMAETPKDGSLLGPVFTNIIAKQMAVTRVADRYFYDNRDQPLPFTTAQLNEIHKASISRLLCDNSDNLISMQRRAFEKIDHKKNNLVKCQEEKAIPMVNLNAWKMNL